MRSNRLKNRQAPISANHQNLHRILSSAQSSNENDALDVSIGDRRLVIAYFQFGREACEKVWLEWIVRSSFLLPEKTKVIVAENRELDCGIAKSIQTAGGFRHPTTRNPESPIGDHQ
ncbi:MAG: hypothetical protein DMG12_11490 [Acidobacteria bacterium]|nr:MAG: hypothetical protein DMG12_11490 [Acidobacteriota bacterium]